MNPETFQDRVWHLLDGCLSPEEFAELESYLEECPEAHFRFVEHVDLHNLLGQRLSNPASVAMPTHGVVPVDHVLARQKRKALRYSALAAAAVLVLGGVVLKIVMIPDPEPMLSFRASEDSIMSVTHLAANDEEPEPGTLTKGSRLVLSQGAVELTLASGVTSVVRAPADLTLHREDRIYQNHGIARFRVPKEATGFQVRTPSLLVTDLGTEFGVISGPRGLDEVHVFEGTVEVLNQRGLRKTETLTGRVARVAGPAGRLMPVSLRPEEFLDSLPARNPHLYFSFDSMEGNKFAVEGDHPDVSAISAWLERGETPSDMALVKGKFGKALRLDGSGDHVLTNWQGISGRSARTIAVWIRLPESGLDRDTQGILAWGNTHVSGGKFEINWNSIPACGQLGALRFDCAEGYVVGTSDLRDGRWHHLAVVFGGAVDPKTRMRVRLYVDGIPEKTSGYRFAEPDTIPGRTARELMSIGRYFDVDLSDRGTLKGELDEVHIFSGVLGPESIRRLMNTGW